jgi:hypothetical protein
MVPKTTTEWADFLIGFLDGKVGPYAVDDILIGYEQSDPLLRAVQRFLLAVIVEGLSTDPRSKPCLLRGLARALAEGRMSTALWLREQARNDDFDWLNEDLDAARGADAGV